MTKNPAPMSRGELEFFFDHYFSRMQRDVEREIDWQRRNPNSVAGNVLCALALVAYTEILGTLIVGRSGRRLRDRAAFNAFLDRLDAGRYGMWRKRWETPRRRLDDILRNGLVHAYAPSGTRLWFDFEGTFGLDYDSRSGLLHLNIEPYHRHFCQAGDELKRELLG